MRVPPEAGAGCQLPRQGWDECRTPAATWRLPGAADHVQKGRAVMPRAGEDSKPPKIQAIAAPHLLLRCALLHSKGRRPLCACRCTLPLQLLHASPGFNVDPSTDWPAQRDRGDGRAGPQHEPMQWQRNRAGLLALLLHS